MKQAYIPTVAELERMTTHELADLIAAIVLVLRQLPPECMLAGFQRLTEQMQRESESWRYACVCICS